MQMWEASPVRGSIEALHDTGQVAYLYGPKLSNWWSGGLAYTYGMEADPGCAPPIHPFPA